jgi:MATE family multidrug resistance protein
MFPLGLSMATSIRLSKAIGAGRPELLRAIGLGSLGLTGVVMLGFAAIFVLGGGWLARVFSVDPAVIGLATHLLVVAAFFQLFDGTQVVASGALRGLTDVKVPTAITFVAYWLVSLPLAYLLGFPLGLGPVGVWSGLAGGLACAALLLGWRLHHRTSA